jgi:hypothetical protein
MKNKNFETNFDVLAKFTLTNDEMISIRGGDDGEPTPVAPPPPLVL